MPNATTALIFGAGGTLGSTLAAELESHYHVISLSAQQVDVTDRAAVQTALGETSPDVVINCAGFLNVDRCETDPEQSYAVNYAGAVNVARAVESCSKARPVLFQFSSDFVFDGQKGSYLEGDPGRPLSYYGLHKLLADESIAQSWGEGTYVFRTASLICCPPARNSFLKRMVALSAEKPRLEIVDDLHVSMVTPEALAGYVRHFVAVRPEPGLYNAVCGGATTWYDITVTAFRELGIAYEIRPTSIEKMPGAAIRPRRSDLNVSKLARALDAQPPTWQQALSEHLRVQHDRYRACRDGASSSRAA